MAKVYDKFSGIINILLILGKPGLLDAGINGKLISEFKWFLAFGILLILLFKYLKF